ncbi:Uma2 family endonuclease [Synechocystis sp. LKSZ1]|uniref:Uma2 family endonuclease n=1 Tax=Synechocystis sp. LKSZ1 TaxID=3144951 RepID=UPI00336C0847
MTVSLPTTYSFEAYCQYDDPDNRYEWVNGQLEKMSPPTFLHLLIADRLKTLINQEIQRLQYPWICLSEIGVRTGWQKSRIADLGVIPRHQALESLEKNAICDDPPLLLVEIVSPDSIQRDYRYKRSEYAALGVAEYWIVDPQEQKITILCLNEGLYDEQVCEGEMTLTSPQFPELQLSVPDVLTIA